MSFYKYLMVKYKNDSNMGLRYMILIIITLVGFKLPPLIVIPLGFLIREYQNYNDWMTSVRNAALRQNGQMPKMANSFLQFLSLIFLLFTLLAIVFLLNNNQTAGTMMIKIFGFTLSLIPVIIPFVIIARYQNELREKEVDEKLQYSQELKEKVVQQVRSIRLNQLKERQEEMQSEDVTTVNDGSNFDLQSQYVQNPVTLNKKLQLKPREVSPNVISFDGDSPKTMFDSQYMEQVVKANEMRKEEAKALLHDNTGVFPKRESFEAQSNSGIHTPDSNDALLDEKHYSQYKERVRQYEKKLEKEQGIKHGSGWFKVLKICPVCGSKSKISKGDKQICEFCGMELE